MPPFHNKRLAQLESKKQRRKFRIESAETLKAWDASGVQLTAAVQSVLVVVIDEGPARKSAHFLNYEL